MERRSKKVAYYSDSEAFGIFECPEMAAICSGGSNSANGGSYRASGQCSTLYRAPSEADNHFAKLGPAFLGVAVT